MFLPAGVARITLNGVNDAVLDFLNNSRMVGNAVLSVFIVPIKENDLSCCRLGGIVRPLSSVLKPIHAVRTKGIFRYHAAIDIAALIGTPRHEAGTPFHTTLKAVPRPIRLTADITYLRQGNGHDFAIAHRDTVAEPYAYALELLRTVPGFNSDPITAISAISEIGVDMSVFPTSKHLVSWAGCCPRNDKSDSKVKSTRISRAGTYLKPLLVQIANAVIRSDKNPEFKERYRRLKARRGHKKAIIAICRMLLTAIWNILSKLEPYSPNGYLNDKLTEHSVVISKAEGLALLRKRGYIFKDEVVSSSS